MNKKEGKRRLEAEGRRRFRRPRGRSLIRGRPFLFRAPVRAGGLDWGGGGHEWCNPMTALALTMWDKDACLRPLEEGC